VTDAYRLAVMEHVSEHIEVLDELAQMSRAGNLSRIERLAVERSLQVLIEACVGAAKHVCKRAGKQHLADAYGCMSKAADIISAEVAPEDLKGAAGMRNAIVHDYLNLEWLRLKAVLNAEKYQLMFGFLKQCLEYLEARS